MGTCRLRRSRLIVLWGVRAVFIVSMLGFIHASPAFAGFDDPPPLPFGPCPSRPNVDGGPVFSCIAPSALLQAESYFEHGKAVDPSAIVMSETGLPLASVALDWNCLYAQRLQGKCKYHQSLDISYLYTRTVGLAFIDRNVGDPPSVLVTELPVSPGTAVEYSPISQRSQAQTTQIGNNPPVTTVTYGPWRVGARVPGRNLFLEVDSNVSPSLVMALYEAILLEAEIAQPQSLHRTIEYPM